MLSPISGDGVWLVELASLSDPALVPHAVAAALGIREKRGQATTDTVLDHLKHRSLMLVLDNCEHLVTACARMADAVLRASPAIRILATSREPLSIAGETVFRVPGLGLPDPERPPDVEDATAHDAVELFVDRASAVKPSFAVTPAMLGPLRRVCTQLDGIPLAIELAASRVRVLSVEQIAERLDDRLSLLTTGSRTALPRHQTLLAAIDWSYNLLSEPEKTMFRRLSVFAGGWTLDAAERVCSGEGISEHEVLELLSGLVDKSLVLAEDRDGLPRYRFMVTLLEYARKRLASTGEAEACRRRHAEFFLALGRQGESRLIGAQQQPWLQRIAGESDNVRAVLAWASTHDVALGLSLAGALGRFWYLRGQLAEGRKWLAELLAVRGATGQDAVRIKAFNAAGRVVLHQGDYPSARSFAEQALALAGEADDQGGKADALNLLAILAGEANDFAAARALLEETLAIRRRLGDQGWTALALNNLGALAVRQSDFVSACALLDEALALSRDVGDPHGTATASVNRGDVARRLGDFVMAHALIEQGLAIARSHSDRTVLAPALSSLANLARLQGDYARAGALVDDAVKLSRELGDKRAIAEAFQFRGQLAEDCDDPATARSAFQESVRLRRVLGERTELAGALTNLGRAVARQGDYEHARALHEEALAIGRQIGARDGVARSLSGLADVARRRSEYAAALSLYRESLILWWELGERVEWPQAFDSVADVLAACGEPGQAARLWGAAEALRNSIGIRQPGSDAVDHRRRVDDARALLGEPFAAEWQRGEASTPADTFALARGNPSSNGERG
jgi:predicted ATPase